MLNILTGMPLREDSSCIEKKVLSEIELAELSLVDRPANKKKFLFAKSENGCTIDLLDTIEKFEKSFELTNEENTAVETAIAALNKLDSDEQDAIAKVILLLGQIELTEPAVKKSDDNALWPSFKQRHKVEKAGIEVDEDTFWPSIVSATDKFSDENYREQVLTDED